MIDYSSVDLHAEHVAMTRRRACRHPPKSGVAIVPANEVIIAPELPVAIEIRDGDAGMLRNPVSDDREAILRAPYPLAADQWHALTGRHDDPPSAIRPRYDQPR